MERKKIEFTTVWLPKIGCPEYGKITIYLDQIAAYSKNGNDTVYLNTNGNPNGYTLKISYEELKKLLE